MFLSVQTALSDLRAAQVQLLNGRVDDSSFRWSDIHELGVETGGCGGGRLTRTGGGTSLPIQISGTTAVDDISIQCCIFVKSLRRITESAEDHDSEADSFSRIHFSKWARLLERSSLRQIFRDDAH